MSDGVEIACMELDGGGDGGCDGGGAMQMCMYNGGVRDKGEDESGCFKSFVNGDGDCVIRNAIRVGSLVHQYLMIAVKKGPLFPKVNVFFSYLSLSVSL